VTADEVNEVARGLWCPLCSGVRLDSCELKACEQMKEVIAIKLAAGEDAEAIKAYFLEQYGPQILGEPPREGFNWLAWILPFAALVGGAFFLWNRIRSMIRPAVQNASESPDSQASKPPEDEYERKLEEELKRYG
jgi:cytochrome c-type biogenesis protein CcmH